MSRKNEENELYKRIEKNFFGFLKRNEIDILNLKQEDVEMFVNSSQGFNNKFSSYRYKSALEKILQQSNPSIKVDSKSIKDKVILDKYFTIEEIIRICDYIYSINPQNAFIVYALWNGIKGKEYKDLLSLKVCDIKEDFNAIYINNKLFECDKHMRKFIESTIKESKYYKSISSSNNKGRDFFKLNMNSKYIIKPMPTKRNNNGLNKVREDFLKRRLLELSKLCTTHFNTQIKLTGTILDTSGIMHKMRKIEIEENKLWKHENIEEFLNSNNIKKNPGLIYSRYYTLYYNSENNSLYNTMYLNIVSYLIENVKNDKLKPDNLYKKFNLSKDELKKYINLLTIDCSINDMPLIPVILFEPSDKSILLDIFKDKISKDKENIMNSELEELYNQEYTRVINFSDWNILIENLEEKINSKDKSISNINNLTTIEDKEVKFTEFADLDDLFLIEGGKLKKYINQNKRNKDARRLKLQSFKSIKGDLFCEICKENDECVLDVHHDSIPICRMNEEHITKLSDLRILCSNCHRKVHFHKLKVDDLIKMRRSKNEEI